MTDWCSWCRSFPFLAMLWELFFNRNLVFFFFLLKSQKFTVEETFFFFFSLMVIPTLKLVLQPSFHMPMQTNVCMTSLNNNKRNTLKEHCPVLNILPGCKIIPLVKQVWLTIETRALIKGNFTPAFYFLSYKSCELRSFPDKGCGRGCQRKWSWMYRRGHTIKAL